MSLLPPGFSAAANHYENQTPDDVGIDIVRDNQIEEIEADTCLYDACAAYDEARLDCEGFSCEIESGGFNWTSFNLGVSLDSQDVDENRTRIVEILRFLADKLEDQS